MNESPARGVVHLLASFHVSDDPVGAATLARLWFERGWEALGGDLPAAVAGRASAPVAAAAPRGFEVVIAGAEDRSYSYAQWPEFLNSLRTLEDAYFEASARVLGVPELDLWVPGSVVDTPYYLSIRLWREGDVVNLDLTARRELILADGAAEDRVTGLLDAALAVRGVDYAEVGRSYSGGHWTMPEREQGLDLTTRWANAGDALRGFSWITVVPPRVATRLGGVAIFTAAGVFHQVRELPQGGVLLRATEHLTEYDDAKAAEVHAVLAPALPPGTRPSAYPVEG